MLKSTPIILAVVVAGCGGGAPQALQSLPASSAAYVVAPDSVTSLKGESLHATDVKLYVVTTKFDKKPWLLTNIDVVFTAKGAASGPYPGTFKTDDNGSSGPYGNQWTASPYSDSPSPAGGALLNENILITSHGKKIHVFVQSFSTDWHTQVTCDSWKFPSWNAQWGLNGGFGGRAMVPVIEKGLLKEKFGGKHD